jgi:hypothetical protein
MEDKIYVNVDQDFIVNFNTPAFVKVDQPLVELSFSFTGKMYVAEHDKDTKKIKLTNEIVDFSIDCKFNADSGPFDYIHDVSKNVFASALTDVSLSKIFNKKST